MYDRAAAFEAWFKRVEDGYIFYPHRFARGISVTEAEHDRMIEAHEALQKRKPKIELIVIVFAICLTIGPLVFSTDDSLVSSIVFVGALTLAVLGLLWLRGRSVREPIRDRKPDRPRRSQKELNAALGRANGRLFLLVGCISAATATIAALSLVKSAPPMNWLFFSLAAATAVLNFWVYFSGPPTSRDNQS